MPHPVLPHKTTLPRSARQSIRRSRVCRGQQQPRLSTPWPRVCLWHTLWRRTLPLWAFPTLWGRHQWRERSAKGQPALCAWTAAPMWCWCRAATRTCALGAPTSGRTAPRVKVAAAAPQTGDILTRLWCSFHCEVCYMHHKFENHFK